MPALEFLPSVAPRAESSIKADTNCLPYADPTSGPDFSPKDTLLWPKVAADMFRAKKNMRNIVSACAHPLVRNHSCLASFVQTHASTYMRWWFEQHAGMPIKPNPPPRSAYAHFFNGEKKRVFARQGSWNRKKDPKAVGATWKHLSAEVKAQHEEDYRVLREKADRLADAYWDALDEWRGKRQARLAASGEVLDNSVRVVQGLTPICTCSICVAE